MLVTNCKKCGKEFNVRKYQLKIGAGKYCSHSCAARSQKVDSLEKRFWEMVDKRGNDKCWEFTGFKNKDGYGIMSKGHSKLGSAHRISYEMHIGIIPNGMVIMHSCDNPSCCNPAHLKIGTQNDNIQDMVSKKRNVSLSKEKASKFSTEIINEIRSKYKGNRGDKLRLSKEHMCSPTTITNILNNWE